MSILIMNLQYFGYTKIGKSGSEVNSEHDWQCRLAVKGQAQGYMTQTAQEGHVGRRVSKGESSFAREPPWSM